jgi:hypothetical protein
MRVLFIQILLVISALVLFALEKYNDIKFECINFAFIRPKQLPFATNRSAGTISDYLGMANL